MTGGLVLAALLAAAQADRPPDCRTPQSQAQRNLCASVDFNAAEDALDALWPRIVEEVRRGDAGFNPFADGRVSGETRLREAQLAWRNYRDAHCTTLGFRARGRDSEPMVYNACRAQLTRDRIDQLRSAFELD